MSLQILVPDMKSENGPKLNDYLLKWCADKLKWINGFSPGSVALGVIDESRLLAVAAFDNYRRGRSGEPLSVEISFAAESPRFGAKRVARGIFAYPFLQLGVQRLTAQVAASNVHAREFDERLGFKIEGRMRQALSGGEDLYILGMTRSEASRWIG